MFRILNDAPTKIFFGMRQSAVNKNKLKSTTGKVLGDNIEYCNDICYQTNQIYNNTLNVLYQIKYISEKD